MNKFFSPSPLWQQNGLFLIRLITSFFLIIHGMEVFDPEKISDLATFDNPNQLSVGMQDVLVNGIPVIAGGKLTGALPGKVLRGPAYQP